MPRRRDPNFKITADDKTRQGIRSAKANFNALGTTVRRFGALFGVALGAETARRILMISDNLRALQIRVKTATKDTGDHVAVWEELRGIAQSTGAEIATTVSTFQDLARVKTVVRASNEDIIALTKTVNQLGVIGGSTTEQLRFGMRQFNQAMSQPFFRAEEFNSLLENIPEVAARIAKGFKLDQGALRQLVIEGKLASKEVFEKLREQAEAIDEEFALIPVTVQRGFAELRTALSIQIRDMDESLGLTEAIGAAFHRWAEKANPTVEGVERSFENLVIQEGLVKSELKLIAEAMGEVKVIDPTDELVKKYGFWSLKLGEINQQLIDMGIQLSDLRRAELCKEVPQIEITKGNDVEREEKERKARRKALLAQQRLEREAHKDAVAQALGFADEKARVIFERELELQQIHNDQFLAAESGFIDLRTQILIEEAERVIAQENIIKERKATGFTELEQMQRDHADRMIEVKAERFAREKGLDENSLSSLIKFNRLSEKLERASGMAKTRIVVGAAADALQGWQGQSKKMFKLQKMFAIADLAVNLPPAIIKSFKNAGGYPWGLIPAGLMAAQGAAQLQAIRGTSFSGGGGIRSPSGGGGGGGGGAGGAIPTTPQPLPDLSPDVPPTVLRVEIRGDIVSGEEEADRIIRIIEERSDADQVFITTGSAQAVEIRGGS